LVLKRLMVFGRIRLKGGGEKFYPVVRTQGEL